ncbi:amino acid ABC transporter permease [Xinfangfangia sp. CPCC 101601]|uniref:Amino acid ABC transporter permease n=1 Tax=Pseudogemmobacter lacusdianii TaxID=3069608 RepID=A0ABU0W1B2_9RHOB|nr:amino acid ABC transporter permease [Xinfangfangia sp. CPCC 101601]MDQ2067788.1 amino acid ABC transporter permease [Xinfangfangia sp. CPCC 101601]
MMEYLDQFAAFLSVYPAKLPQWEGVLIRAIKTTLIVTAGSFAVALVIGVLLALARLSKNALLRGIARFYIEIARGVPALVILFLLYFGLPPLGIVMDAVPTAILGLGLSTGGYVAEIIRAGIEATHKGQREAGLTIGMSSWQINRYIILPQAARISLPSLMNTLITVLKDSSLASLITAPELMLRAKAISSTDFLPMHILLLVGAIYLCLAIPLSQLSRLLERRMFSKLGNRM